MLEISEIYIEIREYFKINDILRRILERYPDNEECLEKLARINMDFQHPHDAIRYCEMLLKINPENINAHITLSDAYYLLQNLDKSLEILEKGLKIHPNSPELWTAKSWLDYVADEIEYKKDLKRIIELHPNNTENYVRLIEHMIWED